MNPMFIWLKSGPVVDKGLTSLKKQEAFLNLLTSDGFQQCMQNAHQTREQIALKVLKNHGVDAGCDTLSDGTSLRGPV